VESPGTRASAAEAAPVAPGGAEAAALPRAAVRSQDVALWLPTFYAALNALEHGRIERHVRVLWFGDSHTAADFWSDAVREPLQARFGHGGPGLVLVGLKYRHGLAQLSRSGKWRMIPRSPAATWPQGDGVLGLAGVGAVPVSEDAVATLQLSSKAAWADKGLRWSVLYRPTKQTSAFRVHTGDELLAVGPGLGRARQSGLFAVELANVHVRELELDGFVDEPELFGVIVESQAPGLVMDTLGINGARAATPLAWNAEAWIEEVKEREPDLVVLAYGTNEVGDPAPVSDYRAHYLALLERLRRAAPHAECLLIGPTDRVRKDWSDDPRVPGIDAAQRAVAEEAGCAFFSAFDAMGGVGSLRKWAFGTPQLARRDRVHLLASGYRRLGRGLADQLLASYGELYPAQDTPR
jgi:lysophospholipase L1-like esterase